MKSQLKPWQLVYVKADDQSRVYVGELVSMPTPEGTIMVRQVPGHPGTATEMPLDRVEPVEAGTWYVHYASINGNRKYFPTDMLRYDQCIPVSFELEWDRERESFRVKIEDGSTMLVIAQVTRRKWPHWTEGRWKSFNWGVAAMSTEAFVQQAGT